MRRLYARFCCIGIPLNSILFTDVDPVTRQYFVIEHHIVRGEIFIYLIEDKTIRYYGNI